MTVPVSVPRSRDIFPGVAVNIVLKADQPTGRLTAGVVRDVLTRGDHPRGVKVRLVDGQIGRVQNVGSSSVMENNSGSTTTATTTATAIVDSADGQRIAPPHPPRGGAGGGGGGGARGPRWTDYRNDGFDDPGAVQVGLDAYIKPAKKKKGKRGGRVNDGGEERGEDGSGGVGVVEGEAEETTTTATTTTMTMTTACPVCGDFEGDEVAVAHHVASHFDDSSAG